MSFATILDTLTTIIWSPALVFVCLAVGIFFTVSTLFMQIRCIPDMFQQIVGNNDSESGVSSFKALMISLASRVVLLYFYCKGYCWNKVKSDFLPEFESYKKLFYVHSL